MSPLFQLLRGEPLSKEPDWEALLAFADRTHLTLYLRGLNTPLHEAIEHRFAKNARRHERLLTAFAEIQNMLEDFVLLKGFTHEQGFGTPPGSRVQYDLDILVPPEQLLSAQQALRSLGYRPHGQSSLSDEHGKPWVRPSDWTWRGDYFDPDMPIPVELHTTIWSPEKDHIDFPDAGQFWSRRTSMELHGLRIPCFSEPDRVTFAALHALRHILRNDVRPAHVLELVSVLVGQRHALPERSHLHGQRMAPPHMKDILPSVAFRFAQEWFIPNEPRTPLPRPLENWFQNYGWSPIENLTMPNKNVVWLHLALIESPRDRVKVIKDRLFPPRLPHREDPSRGLFTRLGYHASALLPALTAGARLWRTRAASSSASHTSD